MKKDLEEFIMKRCENALISNKEYRTLQKQINDAYRKNDIKAFNDLNISMQILVEKICYKACARDTFDMIFNSRNWMYSPIPYNTEDIN